MVRVPVLSLVIDPNTAADRARLDLGLRQLSAEDLALAVRTDAQTGQTTILTSGEVLLEIIAHRLKSEFQVEATLGQVKVLYKEALTKAAEGEGRYVKQIGGAGAYAHARVRVSPMPPGAGYIFDDLITGGRIPGPFIPAVDQGIKEALGRGVVAGYPIDDVKVELFDGSYHDADSSELAFRIAGAMAFRDAAQKAEPILLEPIMRVDVAVPPDYVKVVMMDLAQRRASIQSREDRDGTEIVTAHVPMSELLGYAATLRALTRGWASYSLSFERYQQVRNLDVDGDRQSFVGAPLVPRPSPRASAIALPEPD